ncbi:hypothetical protein VP01_982g5 [Puccinia sorghi]|uniref:Uncharacterized protein n=1 Tax=Puccinia sorghi TaxID=27349 RepID=A0A0L6U670_9BASI|nr:hypothetical protein VP01_982g5 [Puccinia sorghi]
MLAGQAVGIPMDSARSLTDAAILLHFDLAKAIENQIILCIGSCRAYPAKHKIKLEGVKPADVSATLNIKTLLDLFKLIPQAPFNLKIDNLRNQAPKSKIHPNQSVPRSIPSPSTALSLTNSPLIKAVKEPASAFIPQRSIYFALSAKNGIVIPDHLRQTQAQYDDIDCGNYTPINPPSFDHQASSDNVTLASGPTSLAFGPIFANGILNASILNSHYFMEPLDCYGSALNSSPMMPSSSKDPASPSTTKHQILELIGEVKLCSPKQWMIQSGQRNTFYP